MSVWNTEETVRQNESLHTFSLHGKKCNILVSFCVTQISVIEKQENEQIMTLFYFIFFKNKTKTQLPVNRFMASEMT